MKGPLIPDRLQVEICNEVVVHTRNSDIYHFILLFETEVVPFFDKYITLIIGVLRS